MRDTQLYSLRPFRGDEVDLTETYVIWGIKRNDMIGKPIKNINTDEHKVRKLYRDLRKWAKRDFRDNKELWPQLVCSKLKWEVQE